MSKHPHENSRLSKFVTKRVLELRHRKKQHDIATEAGFQNVNMVSLLKSGASRLPLDRAPALARALECDARLLFRYALEQKGYETTSAAIDEVIGTVVSANEVIWLEELREASGNSDPTLTARSRVALRGIFGK